MTLRPLQEEVLTHLARGRSVFAGLPTGYGKSLCYWAPAAAWGWKVWVVSPLVSLIEDQALACASLGLRVVAWHGSETQAASRAMAAGDWQVCFLAPERLLAWSESGYIRSLRGSGLAPDLLVLDEMHCLEEWRSFRSGYAQLFAPVRKLTERGALLLGLSASLSAANGRYWMNDLCGSHELVLSGLGRENLTLAVHAVEREEERWLLMAAALRGLRAPQSALVYCSSREEAEEAARWLRSAGFASVSYHAGHPASWRTARSRAFREGHLRIVCATSAFGMGIDYPYVDIVLHFSLPHDLESYWQEVGRAGRSGAPAYGLAFWRRSEIARAWGMEGEARTRFLALWRAWASGGCRMRAVARALALEQEKCGRCDECCRENSVTVGIPALHPPLPVAWWVRSEAQLTSWLEKNILPTAKNLDAL